jgi:SpoVK/Ycf46/Vps4 family AAA+-type ATPase
MKTQEEIEQLAKKQKGCSKEYCDSIDEQYGYLNGYIDGYTQCQEDNAKKKYTEEDIKKAIELARETERVTLGEEREAWDDIEKYDEMDIIYLLNKQD